MIFDLTSNSNKRKIMTLNPSYPQDVNRTVVKGNTVSATFIVAIAEPGKPDSYTYQWYVNGSAVAGATGPSYTRTGLSATATYTVYCMVSNKAGTLKSRVATLKVTQYYTPALNNSYPANASVAIHNSTTLKVAIATAGYPASCTYQWYKNGSAISGATDSTYTFTPTATGTTTFYCKVTNAAGTVTSRTATITATNLYLYNNGEQSEEVTGGWTSTGVKWGGGGDSYGYGATAPTIKQNASSMEITQSADINSGVAHLKKKINLTKYSKLTFTGSWTAGAAEYCFLGIWSSLDPSNRLTNRAAYVQGAKSDGCSIDVSALSGEYVIGFFLFDDTAKVTVNSLILS